MQMDKYIHHNPDFLKVDLLVFSIPTLMFKMKNANIKRLYNQNQLDPVIWLQIMASESGETTCINGIISQNVIFADQGAFFVIMDGVKSEVD